MWFRVCWPDGRYEVPEDDYGPEWYVVADVEQGTFKGCDGVFDAKPVEGPLRDQLWERYGPP